MKEKKEKVKPKTIEWCETCENPAEKCKRKCIGKVTDNETSKQYNKRSSQ